MFEGCMLLSTEFDVLQHPSHVKLWISMKYPNNHLVLIMAEAQEKLYLTKRMFNSYYTLFHMTLSFTNYIVRKDSLPLNALLIFYGYSETSRLAQKLDRIFTE